VSDGDQQAVSHVAAVAHVDDESTGTSLHVLESTSSVRVSKKPEANSAAPRMCSNVCGEPGARMCACECSTVSSWTRDVLKR
jgi:hypothetical protein